MSGTFGIHQPFPKAVEDITADAIERYPEEACGFVIDGLYVPKKNTAEEPTEGFRIDGRTYVAAEKKGIDAVVHSHTKGQYKHPSKHDMAQQNAMNVPWGIVWTDGDGDTLGPAWWGDSLPIIPLIGRPFIYGIYDCCTLVRDFYRLNGGITWEDRPRDPDWWLTGGNMYVEEYQPCGFERISESEIRAGDAFMSRFQRGNTTQHAGIYLGGNQVLHHLMGRVSRRDTLASWSRYITHWVRHKDMTQTKGWEGLL